MNYAELTIGSFAIFIILGYAYRLRQIHLRSKCRDVIDFQLDVEKGDTNS